MHNRHVGAVAVFVMGLAVAPAAAQAAGVQVLLGAPKDGSGRVIFTLRNTTDAPVQVLRWQTPLRGVTNNIFDVTQGGREAPYIGRLYKRGAPTAADYVELKPGETLSVYVDLKSSYDLRKGGQFSVRYNRTGAEVLKSGIEASLRGAALAPYEFVRPRGYDFITISLATYVVREDLNPPIAGTTATNTFVGCTADRQAKTVTARTNASSYSKTARDYLQANTHGQRYAWWFGAYNAGTNYATVQTHFNNLYSAFSTKPYTFVCTCTEAGAYAWVSKNDAYRVHLCPMFWSTSDTGTDSRAGTLVHETSHFDAVASTDDWAYGQTAAHNLVSTNVAHAIDNGDSHEYFAENTPPQN